MVNAYPNGLRTWVKISTPLAFSFAIINFLIMFTATSHYKKHEHFAKSGHKGNAFEKTLRQRDDRLRYVQNRYFKRQYGDANSQEMQ